MKVHKYNNLRYVRTRTPRYQDWILTAASYSWPLLSSAFLNKMTEFKCTLELELELEVASIQMNEDDSRRGKKQFCLFESPVVPKVKIEFFLEVVDSCTFQ